MWASMLIQLERLCCESLMKRIEIKAKEAIGTLLVFEVYNGNLEINVKK